MLEKKDRLIEHEFNPTITTVKQGIPYFLIILVLNCFTTLIVKSEDTDDPHNQYRVVNDVTTIYNELSDLASFECDFLNGKDSVALQRNSLFSGLKSRQQRSISWGCCRFAKKNEGGNIVHIPARNKNNTFVSYMGAIFFEGAGKTTHIYIRSNGIYINGDNSNRRTAVLIAEWDPNGFRNFTICENPKVKWLQSTNGHTCLSICRKRECGNYLCSIPGGSLDYCTPPSDYHIRENAKNSIVSSNGMACRTECSKANGTYYNWCRIKEEMHKEVSNEWHYCSPSDGYDFEGRSCAGECWFHDGYNYKWCRVKKQSSWGNDYWSWGYC